jgi:hypothetical protein
MTRRPSKLRDVLILNETQIYIFKDYLDSLKWPYVIFIEMNFINALETNLYIL